MSNIKTHAERELDILVKTVDDPIIKDFIPEILALCEKFGNSGQSGASAPYTASAICEAVKKLMLFKPICPIQGTDEEWNDVSGIGGSKGGKVLQNNRCSAIFKEDGGQAYYLDAITWKTQTGSTWSGTAKTADGKEIKSRQFIKEFPFKPKTFVIDVIEKEVKPHDWEFTVKNEGDLKEVFEYYANLLS